jgi:hypothetical protein
MRSGANFNSTTEQANPMPQFNFPPARPGSRALMDGVCALLEQKFPGYHIELDLFELYFFQGSGIGRVARSQDAVQMREGLNSLLDPLNRLLFGNATVIISTNPFFGTAIRFRWGEGENPHRAVVRGIVANPKLRRVGLPLLNVTLLLGLFFYVIRVLRPTDPAVAVAILVPCILFLPVSYLLAAWLARPLTNQVAAALEDAAACEAVDLAPPARC